MPRMHQNAPSEAPKSDFFLGRGSPHPTPLGASTPCAPKFFSTPPNLPNLAESLVLPGSRARIVRCGGRYDPQLVKRSSEWVSEWVSEWMNKWTRNQNASHPRQCNTDRPCAESLDLSTVRPPVPNFTGKRTENVTFMGATCPPCGAKNPFLDKWVSAIPVLNKRIPKSLQLWRRCVYDKSTKTEQRKRSATPDTPQIIAKSVGECELVGFA